MIALLGREAHPHDERDPGSVIGEREGPHEGVVGPLPAGVVCHERHDSLVRKLLALAHDLS